MRKHVCKAELRKPEYLLALERLSRQVVDNYYEGPYFRQTYERAITISCRNYRVLVDHVAVPLEYYEDAVRLPKCFWAVRISDGLFYNDDQEMQIVKKCKTFDEARVVADTIYDNLLEAAVVVKPKNELFIKPRPQLACKKVITYTLMDP